MVLVLEKQKLLELFEEVLGRFKSAEQYVIHDTFCIGDEYDYEDLEKEIEEYKRKFLEALDN